MQKVSHKISRKLSYKNKRSNTNIITDLNKDDLFEDSIMAPLSKNTEQHSIVSQYKITFI